MILMISISLFYCCEKVFTHRNIFDMWENFNEISLPEKENFYSHINMEDITDADYTQAKIVCKDFQMKIPGEYQDLCF